MNGIPLPPSVETGIKALGNFMLGAIKPDRKLPHLGDDDGGRLLAFDGLPGDDPSGIFNLLGVLFNCEECAFVSDDFSEETLWLLGSNARQVLRRTPTGASKVFEETGYAFLRTGWSEDSVYVSFDFGSHGWLNGGHAHADMLSVEVYAGRQGIIIDPGTFSYQKPWRNWFRGPESHAVILLDGIFPSSPKEFFHWEKESQILSSSCRLDNRLEYVSGTMDAGLWRHTREVYCFLELRLIVLLDTINCTGNHRIDARFPLADTQWYIDENDAVCRSSLNERVCSIQCETGGFHQLKLLNGWKSMCYGCREKINILVVSLYENTPITLGTIIDLSGRNYKIRRARSLKRDSFQIYTDEEECDVVTVESLVPQQNVWVER